MSGFVRVVGVVVLGVAALVVAWLLGMRNKGSVVVAAQRRFNRAVVNPRQLRTAGTPGSQADVICHTGRSSGRPYETPVGAEPTGDGFVVALVYGPRSDWLKNVLASGSATVVHQGVPYAVDRPEVVPLDTVAHHFPDLRSLRTFGVTEALRLHQADADPPDEQSSPGAGGADRRRNQPGGAGESHPHREHTRAVEGQ
jgi:deazaflavin-dependent oxidoreductase (nitroreductase family)